MIYEAQDCPNCHQPRMPDWHDSIANARCCQNCGHIEERITTPRWIADELASGGIRLLPPPNV